MLVAKFFNVFDKEKFIFGIRIIILFVILFLIVNIIGISYSRYESLIDSSAKAKVAFFIVDEGSYSNSISLTGLIPSDEEYIFPFNVSNFKNDKITNVNIEYSIIFTATTNLPLEFEIQQNGVNIITKDEITQDENGVYYRVLNTDSVYTFGFNEKQTNTYDLIVKFPKSYENMSDQYQSLIDLFTITIDAKQVV